MIFENGFIQLINKEVVTPFDSRGYATAPLLSYGDKIPAQIRHLHLNFLNKSSGSAFTSSKYEILIDLRKVDSERLVLIDDDGVTVGDFSIVEKEDLKHVGLTRIIV